MTLEDRNKVIGHAQDHVAYRWSKGLHARHDMPYKGWHEEDSDNRARAKIRDWLELGYRVTAGYYTTSVRNYHRYVVLHKQGFVPKIKRSDYTKQGRSDE